jgi:N-acetylmuramoyl-L-alanine amidase
MITILYYLLKVILCSGLLFSYYWLVLRNKQFHQYNRFYLLGISIIPWLVPFIKINIVKEQVVTQTAVIHFANMVADGNSTLEKVVVEQSNLFTWDRILIVFCISISLLFIIRFIKSLWNIRNLIRHYPITELMGYYLVMTNVKGTPFSFFRYIFWNESIDLNSEVGEKILAHEVVHIEENHSFDKFLIELQMIIGWFNPILWLIKNELYLIHEFIADQKSIENKDASVLAQLLLASAYPSQQHILSNSFFYSPIKRRIKMLTQSTFTKFSYLRRLSILPIMVAIAMLFAFRTANNERPILKLDKQYTVVIDAGHGGTDPGANSLDGVTEKTLTLEIVEKIKELNTNPNIKIVLTRESDNFISATERANFSNKEKADLFLSIHMGSSDNIKERGGVYYVPYRKNTFTKESMALAESLQFNTVKLFGKGQILKRDRGVWVIENVLMPAVLFECGFISNKNDVENIKFNEVKLANNVLTGIEAYLANMKEISK